MATLLARISRLFLVEILLSACSAAAPSGSPTAAPSATLSNPTSPVQTAAQDTPLPGPVSTPNESSTHAPQSRADAVLSGLIAYYETPADPGPMDLTSRMAYYQVPGVSIAVIEDGQVEWAEGFGLTRADGGEPVTSRTLFQAASMSKPVSAVGALTLVRDGLLDLDSDVNQALTSWQVPDSQLTAQEKVTLRRLLSHTAGLSVHGFAGYPQDAPLPTAVQILDGAPTANSAPVRVSAVPGSGYDYSGGGYVLLQQLMMDVTGQDFETLMHERVLEPAGMGSAGFTQPLPELEPGSAASGHRVARVRLPGGSNVYPELAPAGLWATPTDLAHFLIEVGRSDRGEHGGLLPQPLAMEMLTAVTENNGLGWVLPGDGMAGMFGHGGSNAGFRGLIFAVRGAQQGAVVMANSDTGMDLIFEIFRAIQQVYEWPDAPQWRAVGRDVLEPAGESTIETKALTGVYSVQNLTLAVQEGPEGLLVQVPVEGPAYRLYPVGPDEFVTAEGAQWIFDRQGGILQMNGWGGTELTARKNQ